MMSSLNYVASNHSPTHSLILSLNHTQSQALLVLPFFTTLPEEPLAALQGALEALVASHFPMQSDEFPRGSPQRNNYMDCVRKVSRPGAIVELTGGYSRADRGL